MAQIREFLEGQCIDNTLIQLRREQALLEEKLREMQRRKSLIEKRIAGLEEAGKTETGDDHTAGAAREEVRPPGAVYHEG